MRHCIVVPAAVRLPIVALFAIGLFATGCGDELTSGPVIPAQQDTTGDLGSICKGTENCPCETDDDCPSGICVLGPDGEKVCAKPCGDGCAPGWLCKKQNGANGTLWVCVPDLIPGCVPKKEICDGKDNDCDGKTDEGYCDDGNPCTNDICDPSRLDVPGSGSACVSTPASIPCEDGNLCTIGDTCIDAKCVTGKAKSCEDGLFCTKNACDLPTGGCTLTLLDGPCDDESVCTKDDACKDGLCKAGSTDDCDDNNPCTDDTCDPAKGCLNAHNDGACEDGDKCTQGDKCVAGTCKAAPTVDCDDANPCTDNFCDPTLVTDLSKGCTATFIVGSCDDGDGCTLGDACKDGTCSGKATKSCDDGKVCTIDGCDAKGNCKHTVDPGTATCSDGNKCTTNDACTPKGDCVGKKQTCDDANPCTLDICDKLTGLCQHPNHSGAGCEDGDKCTLGDACVDGKCAPGTKKLCDDSLACTDDSCSPANGACLFKANAGTCEDGNKCTTGDACKGGKCVPGKKVVCDDGEICTVDKCVPLTGKCAKTAAVDGLLCEDGAKCTHGDRCKKGVCQAGALLSCDDFNPCTDDSCEKSNGKCLNANNTATCEDGNICTTDQCKDGKCVSEGGASGKPVCACQKNADCAKQDDGNPCNGTLFCELATHTCKVNSSSLVTCDKSKDTTCAKFACSPKTGVCEATPANNGMPCDADGSKCSHGDVCGTGVCKAGPKLACNDNNPCTKDSCKPLVGCLHTPIPGPCQDGNACTLADRCKGGKCAASGKKKVCNDNTVCTLDRCNVVTGKCSYTKLSGQACNDGNKCTTLDLCVGGVCKPTGLSKKCNDSNPCTIDGCNGKTGKCTKKWATNNTPCNDGNACTGGDRCIKGKCIGGKQPGCVSSTSCFSGTCNKVTGKCVYKPANEGKFCSDGNACTLDDVCINGFCSPKDGKICDDNDPCTADACLSGKGTCSYTPASDGIACNDDDKCTSGDVCKGGKCGHKVKKNCNDNDACTIDGCDAKTGKCLHGPATNGTKCSDGNVCTSGDKCLVSAGKSTCQPGKSSPCADGGACQAILCDKSNGKCSYIAGNETGPCDDGVGCTISDVCKKGKCIAEFANGCDDEDACTVDSCDKAADKCVHVPGVDGIACDDGDLCTFGDACKAGLCVPKTKTDCDDNNVCTEDTCDQATGSCKYPPRKVEKPLECDDGNKCTVHRAYLKQTGKFKDLCILGKCVGQARDCNDKNTCTFDGCHAKTGCWHKPTPAKPCNDGNHCTVGDRCSNGSCKGKGKKCNDGNVCTNDSCLTSKGCTFKPRGGGCSDGSVCTKNDVCKGGKCRSGKAINCSDNKPCTDDGCNAKIGCWNKADNKNKCSDGEPCTAPDRCVSGACKAGKAVVCNDGNVCTADSCKLGVGCQYIDLGTKTCDDGNVCTGPDACSKGKCRSAGAKNCSDGNACTIDACDQLNGCYNLPHTGPCSDGDACTAGDACGGGKCKPGQKVSCGDGNDCTIDTCSVKGGCAHANKTGACDDGNPCTNNDACNAGQCAGSGGKDCSDGSVCTKDACSATSKTGCVHTKLNSGACDDGDDCTLDDACKLGSCTGGAKTDCNDGNVCTDDVCKKAGGCTNEPRKFGQQQQAKVGSSANVLMSSQAKAGPGGLPVPTNLKKAKKVSGLKDWTNVPGGDWIWHDGPAPDPTKSSTAYMQVDFNVPAGSETLGGKLTIAADNSFECFLNNKLVGATQKNNDAYKKTLDIELGPAMKVGANRLVCAIHNIGKAGDTAQTNKAGVAFAMDASWYKKGESPACEDGNACTGSDACDAKAATCKSGFAKNCDDDSACTTDSCSPAGNNAGCQHKATNVNPCNDGSICTTGDHCSGGKCVGKGQIGCDDGDACTLDLCHALSGCYGEAMKDGVVCDDNNPCTQATSCKTTGGKTTCGGGVGLPCDDGNPCTTDECKGTNGCVTTAVDGGACDDGNTCTTSDICKGGVCAGSKAAACDDGNACTTDSCLKSGGCQHKGATGPACDDNNACTSNDACSNGTCTSGKLKACFDSQQCTSDSCDSATGKCVFTKVSDGECDDGNLCTLNDKCKAGVCVSGPAAPCGDNNTCTLDSCDPSTGKCVYKTVAEQTGCNDGNTCTTNDRCQGNSCVGQAKACGDGNPCTVDGCNPKTGGCTHDVAKDGTSCSAGPTKGTCKTGVCVKAP